MTNLGTSRVALGARGLDVFPIKTRQRNRSCAKYNKATPALVGSKKQTAAVLRIFKKCTMTESFLMSFTA